MSTPSLKIMSGKSWISKSIGQLQKLSREQRLQRSAGVSVRIAPTGTTIVVGKKGRGGGGEGAVWL